MALKVERVMDGRALITPAVNQHVQDLAFVIDGTPEIHPFAGDPDNHLVKMPAVARSRTVPPEPPCDHRPEFQHPAAHALVRDVQPALGKKFLDVAIAQRETQVEPHSMLNDNRRKAVAAVSNFCHRVSLTVTALSRQPVILTRPRPPCASTPALPAPNSGECSSAMASSVSLAISA